MKTSSSHHTPPASNEGSVRDWNNFNHNAFLTEFRSIDWDLILQTDAGDPNISFDNLFNSVNCLLDKYAPLQKEMQKEKKDEIQSLDY